MWTFLWLSHNSEKGYAVIVTFCYHRHSACHTTSVSLSTYCDITMAATVTTTLVKEVLNMQISVNSGFWRTTTRITVKILFYKMPTSQLQLLYFPVSHHYPTIVPSTQPYSTHTHTVGRRCTVGIVTWTAVYRTCQHWQHGRPCTVTVSYGILNGLFWHTHMLISNRG